MTSKDDLIAAARAVAAKKGTSRLGCREFLDETRVNPKQLYRYFANWRELCDAAGLQIASNNARIADPALFLAMRDAFIACGGIGTCKEFDEQFAYSYSVLTRRFRTWRNALEEFAAWASKRAPGFPYRDALARRIATLPLPSPPESVSGPPWPSRGTRPCGDALGFRGLAHAPINEMGVVFAFGMIAEELGYSVEAIASGFPDCMAKRRVAGERWENVRIEFEYRSRSFRAHRHPEDGCDIIVCWEHDWTDCPLEVLELKSAIGRLA